MTSATITVNDGLDYLLDHFNHQIQLWPRTISTRTTEARQVIAYSKEEALARFAQANFIDCRISAYPHWRPTISSNFVGIKNTIAPNFIMIDFDACNFDDDYDELAHILRQTLWRIRDNLAGYKPTVIWSGRGYHIHIQMQAPVLEDISEFSSIDGISTKFVRFAESYLSGGKSDHAHNSTVSLNNCMLRVPGSINSKNGATVNIVKPSKCKPANVNYGNDISHYYWVEKLLQTPIPDYRRKCIWRILAPYLINVRKLSREQSFGIISDWLDKCSQVRRLYFSGKSKINQDLANAIKKGYYPLGMSKLCVTEKEFAELLQKHGIFD